MAKISKECTQEALTALKNFTKEDLEDYVHDVFMRAKSLDTLQGAKAIAKATKEINDERLKEYFASATQKAKNIQYFENDAKLLREKKLDMRGLLAARGEKLAENISGSQKAAYQQLFNYVLGDLNHEEIEHLASGKFDEAILNIHDGKEINDAFSKKIAGKIKDYFTYVKSQLVLSGAMKFDEFNEGRFFSQVHDQERIINASKSLIKIAMERTSKKYNLAEHKTIWRNFIKKYIDIDKTFQRTKAIDLEGKVDLKEVDKILDRIFDNITTGKSEIFTRSVVANDREVMANKSRMFFYWKDLKSQYEYNKVFGRGNLFGMMMRDMQSSSSKIGTARMWGDNAYTMYNDLKKVQQEVNPKSALWWRNTDNYFKSVMGLDKQSISPTLTTFMSNLRTIATMARLPFIALDSISDIGYVAAFGQRMGIDYSKVYLNQLNHIFDRFPNEERKRIARLMKVQVDSHLGYMGRWVDNASATDLLNKISTKFFKVNMLSAFDRGNKIGIMHMMAKHLFENSSQRFADLNANTQRWINKFLTKDEWNLLKKKNKNSLFTTENVDALSDEEIKAHHEKTGMEIPLSEVRNDLYRKVYSMFSVASENAVLSPTEFEKAFLLQGQSPGTIPGEFLRAVSHFKMYTLAYVDRVLIHGFKEADTASQKLMWASSMLMGTIPLSVMSIYFHNIAQGLTMPVWDDMNVPERYKYLVSILAPSLAIFSGLLDPRNQNSSLVWSMLGSPSTSLIANAMSAPIALAEGDPKRAAKNLGKAANYVFPIQTFPGISPLIRQAMGDEAHLEPGQTHIFGR